MVSPINSEKKNSININEFSARNSYGLVLAIAMV
jgi:hypothetical protein